MSCIIHVTSSSEVVAGTGRTPRDVISRATSGTQAPVSERRCEESVLLRHADLKYRHPSCSASQGSYCCHPPCSTDCCDSCTNWSEVCHTSSSVLLLLSHLGLRNRYSSSLLAEALSHRPSGWKPWRLAREAISGNLSSGNPSNLFLGCKFTAALPLASGEPSCLTACSYGGAALAWVGWEGSHGTEYWNPPCWLCSGFQSVTLPRAAAFGSDTGVMFCVDKPERASRFLM